MEDIIRTEISHLTIINSFRLFIYTRVSMSERARFNPFLIKLFNRSVNMVFFYPRKHGE